MSQASRIEWTEATWNPTVGCTKISPGCKNCYAESMAKRLKGVETFDVIEGVWVAHPRAALSVATVLRHTLLQVSNARQVSEGQQTKTEMVYQYLTGPRFRHRVEAIVEAFSSMNEDLDKERKAIMKQWAKREQQIERVMEATVGMYGDLQGIAGKSLQEIEGLELPALTGPIGAADL